MFKILLAAFALLAVASATDVYSAFYSNGDCTGAPAYSLKITLHQCFNDGTQYRRVAFDGSTYSTGFYSDSACQTTLTTVDANPFTGSAGVCTAYTASSVAKSAKILSASDYASNSGANYDCTSGQCVEITNEPTNAPTNAPTNDGVIVTISFNTELVVDGEWVRVTEDSDCVSPTVTSCGSCRWQLLTCYLVKLDQCYDTTPEFPDRGYSEGGSFKLTLSGSTYSYTMYKATGCADADIASGSLDYSEYSSDPNPITATASDTATAGGCTDFVISYKGYLDQYFSLKVMSSSDYVTATNTYDCTSGTCTTVTNSAADVSIGILSACLAVMAQWIA